MGDALNKVTEGRCPKQTPGGYKSTQGVGGCRKKLMKMGCANNSDGKQLS